MVSMPSYLRIQRWRLEAELVNIGEKRPVQLFSSWWHIQAALSLLLSHNFCITRGGFMKKISNGLAFKEILLRTESKKWVMVMKSNLPSGLSGRPIPSQLMLHWLLTLDVREPKGWRGMVPMTKGRFRDRFIAPGMSTYTCTHTQTNTKVG